MKILFIEDELSKNIPRIVRLFGKFLGKVRIERLNALENDPSGYGASPDEIKQIIEETGIVEADFYFPEVLRKIRSQYDRYALFIVDRNLGQGDYPYQEALAADPDFSESIYEDYHEREGDYLLLKLAFRGLDVRQLFFFMTAYDAGYELKSASGLQEIIGHLGNFKFDNFIEKGNENHLSRLKEIIENHRDLHLVFAHQHHVNLVRKYLDEETAKRFTTVLLEKDVPGRIGGNLNEIRQIYQKILNGCCGKIPIMANKCVDKHGNVVFGAQTVDWLQKEGHINSIIRNHCFSIMKISSDFGAHDNSSERQIFSPNIDTVNALFFALKDVIGWYGKICARFDPTGEK